MTPEEQNLITGLFDRLRQADTGPKDPGAEQLIHTKTAELPAAPYLMAQAVLVQEHALANAQARIADLERQVAAGGQASQQGGSFLSGVAHLFGSGKPSQATPPPVPPQAPSEPQARPASAPPPITVVPQAPPYPSTVQMAPSSGGSFLQSAMATAAGVAGGSLLFQGIENLIGHNAGPFGPAMAERGGFFGQPTGGPTEVVENNYYMGGEPGKTQEDQLASDPNADQNQFADYDPSQDTDSDSDFDDGGGGGDDSTFA